MRVLIYRNGVKILQNTGELKFLQSKRLYSTKWRITKYILNSPICMLCLLLDLFSLIWWILSWVSLYVTYKIYHLYIKYRTVILGQILYLHIFIFRLNRCNNIFSRRCMAWRLRRILVLLYYNLSSPTTNYCCPSIFFKMASNGQQGQWK